MVTSNCGSLLFCSLLLPFNNPEALYKSLYFSQTWFHALWNRVGKMNSKISFIAQIFYYSRLSFIPLTRIHQHDSKKESREQTLLFVHILRTVIGKIVDVSPKQTEFCLIKNTSLYARFKKGYITVNNMCSTWFLKHAWF